LELFEILSLKQDQQLQQIVDKTIMEGDLDRDGKLSFEEFAQMVSNTVGDISFVSRLILSLLTLRTL
jgi:Ca2+-binding EF-hand superfamily protein